ncbi:protein Flattop homolog [Drosophila rhopaloa]|uniref:Cilia- and flagella-associated protein 126 n=1 Tax=Drosophila rhopaloa TaxID=1041015 RepID=A0A6P4F427_DRORH|nr:protein Flattop homolog [Drosophila rhopaloa]
MALHFSAQQFEGRFQSKRLDNWEYPRFAAPRPRGLKKNAKVLASKNGHLLPGVKKEGNSFGQYRGTYELPLRITRSFCAHYDACLSGRYKFAGFPRDLCSCQRENRRALACDQRMTLGQEGDPHWMRQKCQTKCEGLQQIQELHDLSQRCKRAKCKVVSEKTVRMPPKAFKVACVATEKRRRKRTITAFPKTRPAMHANESAASYESRHKPNPPPEKANKDKKKDTVKEKEKDKGKDKDKAKEKGKEKEQKASKGHS